MHYSNRCLPSELGKHRVLCKPPLKPSGQSIVTGTGSASLEDITVVPNSTSHADRPSLVGHSEARCSGQQGSMHLLPQLAVAMAHLRKKF